MTPTSIKFSNFHLKIENTGLIESVGDGDDEDNDDRSRWSPVAKMLVGGRFGTPLALFPRSLRGQLTTRRSDTVTSSPRSVCPVFPKEKKRKILDLLRVLETATTKTTTVPGGPRLPRCWLGG